MTTQLVVLEVAIEVVVRIALFPMESSGQSSRKLNIVPRCIGLDLFSMLMLNDIIKYYYFNSLYTMIALHCIVIG